MISRAIWALLAMGCGGDAPAARSRVLDKIPAGVTSLGVADARALASPRFRPLVDALRAELPAGFDCVADAALAGEQVAAGITPSGDTMVAIATRAKVTCAALSQIEDGLWVATIGGGAPGAGAVAEQPRAKPFLRDAPIAIVTTIGKLRVIATAQPEPLAAWAAFDAPDVATAQAFAASLEARLAKPGEAIAPVAKAITIERTGSQVVARLGKTDADLAVALRAALTPAPETARAFPCPSPLTPPVQGCKTDEAATKLEVYSLASAIDELLAARKEVVIYNGRASGVRLRDELATYGLASGDVLVAIDGKHVTSLDQIEPYLQNPRSRTRLLVERMERHGTIELVEP